MYNDEKEITFLDVITKGEDFWAGFIMGIFFAFLGLMFIWSIFTLISGNDPAWDLISIETGNFIGFLSILISGYKNYNSCYDKLNRERLRRIEERREWEENN